MATAAAVAAVAVAAAAVATVAAVAVAVEQGVLDIATLNHTLLATVAQVDQQHQQTKIEGVGVQPPAVYATLIYVLW
jgi:hypothetical protein